MNEVRNKPVSCEQRDENGCNARPHCALEWAANQSSLVTGGVDSRSRADLNGARRRVERVCLAGHRSV